MNVKNLSRQNLDIVLEYHNFHISLSITCIPAEEIDFEISHCQTFGPP